jgi:hypothetical protein
LSKRCMSALAGSEDWLFPVYLSRRGAAGCCAMGSGAAEARLSLHGRAQEASWASGVVGEVGDGLLRAKERGESWHEGAACGGALEPRAGEVVAWPEARRSLCDEELGSEAELVR